jgi:hypothetical protein
MDMPFPVLIPDGFGEPTIVRWSTAPYPGLLMVWEHVAQGSLVIAVSDRAGIPGAEAEKALVGDLALQRRQYEQFVADLPETTKSSGAFAVQTLETSQLPALFIRGEIGTGYDLLAGRLALHVDASPEIDPQALALLVDHYAQGLVAGQ